QCLVDGGTGTVLGDVTDIAVACALQRFPLGGTITGLDAGGLVLSESATVQQLGIAAGATTFTFPQLIDWGTTVTVGVAMQPLDTLCRVANGGGAVLAPRSDVTVDCKHGSVLGGTITGLA